MRPLRVSVVVAQLGVSNESAHATVRSEYPSFRADVRCIWPQLFSRSWVLFVCSVADRESLRNIDHIVMTQVRYHPF